MVSGGREREKTKNTIGSGNLEKACPERSLPTVPSRKRGGKEEPKKPQPSRTKQGHILCAADSNGMVGR